MPATSEKQLGFMRAELGRKRAGKKTRTGMSEKQLEEFASMPMHKGKKHTAMKMKSNMPKGASQSPKGDIGAKRQAEGVKAGNKFGGKSVSAAGKFGSI